LGMEPLETQEAGKPDDLQKSLSEALKGANAEAMQKALEVLKKK